MWNLKLVKFSKHLLLIFIYIQNSVASLLINSRIVNGQNANISNFQYQLSLQIYNKHECGASVLSSKWALTAGHCVKNFEQSPSFISLRGGSSFHNNGGIRFSIKVVKVHPLYNPNNLNFDVAILYTHEEIIGNFISPIKLPEIDDKIITNSKAIASGWGRTSFENLTQPDILQFVELIIIDQIDCNNRLLEYGEVLPNKFCAFEENKDTCQGDSGGPIIQANNLQIGIVSFGIECASLEYPGVYTRLAYPSIRAWIRILTGI